MPKQALPQSRAFWSIWPEEKKPEGLDHRGPALRLYVTWGNYTEVAGQQQGGCSFGFTGEAAWPSVRAAGRPRVHPAVGQWVTLAEVCAPLSCTFLPCQVGLLILI